MIGLKRNTVKLYPHSNEWGNLAEATIKDLKDIFSDKAVDVQHVGSTSIKEIKAKPIIDIAVGVKSFEDVEKLIETLEDKGFIHVKKNDDESQRFFSCGDFDANTRTHHIHVVIFEDKEWCDYIKFRDTLNNDVSKRRAYEELKLNLEKKYPNNRCEYTEAKADFISGILNG
ncbi:GrpB family protein [Clostridium sardiniense]|uniref:GrpB family protein n=1 Tax=Clostridium sardiniense TaxID=29369 RepID=A0ABS7KT95_CLOSR|nr:GrpB family protein [Clostridium sardiniense]MBY0754036.1 GrpB family protein [Clostridium sardiniense]MDQ0459446.1 GrpB-like predicted nucleotidyltransferase (UPF0157 family) [Clostridium sardiniense]